MEGSALKMSPKSSSGRVQREAEGREEAIDCIKRRCVSIGVQRERRTREDSQNAYLVSLNSSLETSIAVVAE